MGDDEFDASSFPTLYEWDTDSDPPSGWVTYLQQVLVSQQSDPGTVDGVFGPNTAGAVHAFQESAGCTADSVVGNQTWAALHGQSAAPGVNRTNPHHGGGGGGGQHRDPSAERIYFSTDPGYSSAADAIVFELVTTHGDPIPSGTLIATLTVTGPDHSELLQQNFFADADLVPVAYVNEQSIHVGATSDGGHTATIVLDEGKAQTRTFTFHPQVAAQ
jgi:peptidoglycan hydrolase-like protein with peptidoglycan-binding domain